MPREKRWRKVVRVLKRELWQRKRPIGLLSPIYLWPYQHGLVALHRRFWWQQGQRWPRLVWIVLQLSQWLRWQCIHSVPAYYRALKSHGPVIARKEGLSLFRQARSLARLGVCWCIHPLDAYRFRLYREPGRALDYVYAAETAAFHDWRSTGRARLPNSKALIQDKTALAGLLSRHQIPVVKTLASPTALQQQRPLSELMGDTQHVFCKMNGGHMGIGAFAAWRTPSGVAGKKLTGEVLVDSAAVDVAWQALCQLDQPLIQPFLQNHPAIAALSHDGTVIRVRLATEWTYNHPSANEPINNLIAFMVVPAGQSASLAPINMVFPIVMDSGQLGQPLHPIVMSDAYVQAYTRISQLLPPDFTLPCWSELNTHSHRCHQLMTDIQSIAWDWVITSTGPVLLEGNTAWGLNIPQQIVGGFLTKPESQ